MNDLPTMLQIGGYIATAAATCGVAWYMIRGDHRTIGKVQTRVETLEKKVVQHDSWAQSKEFSLSEKLADHGIRISTLESERTKFAAAVEKLDNNTKEIDRLRERFHDMINQYGPYLSRLSTIKKRE